MVTREYNFKKDLEDDRFVDVFVDFLIKRGVKKDLIVRKEGYFPAYDIQVTGDTTYEIKRDHWYEKTGNLLIEDMYDVEDNKTGWIRHTRAEWLIVFINEHEFYSIKITDLILHFYHNRDEYKELYITQSNGHHTRIFLYPIIKLNNVSWGDVRGKPV
jgi:spore coat polysaccharide biosynthesis predicted glycosyltransferase SpsG